ELKLKVPKESDFLFKCAEWNYYEKKCDGSWNKIMDLSNEQTVSIPFTPLDPGYGFAKKENLISFDRLFECPKCGQHKVPPLTTVTMTITAETQEFYENAVLTEFFPVEWQIVLENGGIVSDHNSEFKKIEWIVGNFTGTLTQTYQIFSPERTIPPTDYYFFTSIGDENSDYWTIKVADPTVFLQTCVANDAAPTEETWADACDGGADATNDFLNSDDGDIEVQSTTKNKYAGLKITANNWGVSDCVSITNVTLYYKWWGTIAADTVHYIAVSDDGSTWFNAVTAVNPTSEPGSVSNVDATSIGVTWDCADFGAGGAAIKTNIRDNGLTGAYSWDVLYLDVTYTPKGTLSFAINNPSADNNVSINENENFLVNGTTTCNTNNCGTVDTNLQYCVGASCSTWYDMNTANDSPLYLVSGANPQSSALNAGENYAVSWAVNANIDNTYELRFSATGTTATANTSSGTDRTITVQAAAADYTFTVLLPSSGCTQGKGSYDAGTDCERGYFETTDLAGLADETEVDAQGQVSDGLGSDIAFIVYDNQSTASNDMNFDIDLNAALPATLKLKVSQIWNGWEASCSGNAQTGCIDVTATPANIGTAVYSTGTHDLNLFVWGDFIGAGVLGEDRNFYSASKAST
ncbi:MAG: hypothetical protein ABH986_06515, partial [archaeon]